MIFLLYRDLYHLSRFTRPLYLSNLSAEEIGREVGEGLADGGHELLGLLLRDCRLIGVRHEFSPCCFGPLGQLNLPGVYHENTWFVKVVGANFFGYFQVWFIK